MLPGNHSSRLLTGRLFAFLDVTASLPSTEVALCFLLQCGGASGCSPLLSRYSLGLSLCPPDPKMCWSVFRPLSRCYPVVTCASSALQKPSAAFCHSFPKALLMRIVIKVAVACMSTGRWSEKLLGAFTLGFLQHPEKRGFLRSPPGPGHSLALGV